MRMIRRFLGFSPIMFRDSLNLDIFFT